MTLLSNGPIPPICVPGASSSKIPSLPFSSAVVSSAATPTVLFWITVWLVPRHQLDSGTGIARHDISCIACSVTDLGAGGANDLDAAQTVAQRGQPGGRCADQVAHDLIVDCRTTAILDRKAVAAVARESRCQVRRSRLRSYCWKTQ